MFMDRRNKARGTKRQHFDGLSKFKSENMSPEESRRNGKLMNSNRTAVFNAIEGDPMLNWCNLADNFACSDEAI